MKKVLTIAGSDCIGGAGIQADIKTFSAFGTYAMSVVTAIVAENTCRVIDIQDVNPDIIEKQLEAVFEDVIPDAIKIGMLANIDAMEVVANFLKKQNAKNIVVDPVMYAKNGDALMDIKNMSSLIEKIIPLADIITPNIAEAEHLANMKITSIEDMKEASKKIYEMGCKNVLIKSGNSFEKYSTDILYDGKEFYYFETPKVDTKNTHGTGCTFSSAIAANLALENNLNISIKNSKEYIYKAIKSSFNIGHGNGPTNHFFKFFK